MKNLTIACAVALMTFTCATIGSAQIITYYTASAGPGQSAFDSTYMYTLTTPVTDPKLVEASFTGSLQDVSLAPVTASATETIRFGSGGVATSPIEATLTSGALSSSSVMDPDPFGMGEALSGDVAGTYDEVFFTVVGTLSSGSILDFQGALDFSDVPEPSLSAMLLCGLGALGLVVLQRRNRLNA